MEINQKLHRFLPFACLFPGLDPFYFLSIIFHFLFLSFSSSTALAISYTENEGLTSLRYSTEHQITKRKRSKHIYEYYLYPFPALSSFPLLPLSIHPSLPHTTVLTLNSARGGDRQGGRGSQINRKQYIYFFPSASSLPVELTTIVTRSLHVHLYYVALFPRAFDLYSASWSLYIFFLYPSCLWWGWRLERRPPPSRR